MKKELKEFLNDSEYAAPYCTIVHMEAENILCSSPNIGDWGTEDGEDSDGDGIPDDNWFDAM